jgi:hypothetical protein
MRREMVWLALLAPVTGACGCEAERTAERDCRDEVAVLCERRHRCLDGGQLEARGLPATEVECVAAEERQRGCNGARAESYCGTSAIYRSDAAAECIAELAAASCGQLDAPDLGAPACERVCVEAPARDDGGSFALSWSLADRRGDPISCGRAGVAGLEVTLHGVSRAAAGGDSAWIERFGCEAAVGITKPHPLGFYRVGIRLVDGEGTTVDDLDGSWRLDAARVDLGHFTWSVP